MKASEQNTPEFVQAQAPGKAVLSGEYAVLLGAPSLVMAVDRIASCSVRTTSSGVWNFTSTGFNGSSQHTLDTLTQPNRMKPDDPARLFGWVLSHQQTEPRGDWLAKLSTKLPESADVRTNTEAMFEGENKLGIGSSAALITAISGCVATLTGNEPPSFESIHRAHQASQGGIGSGLDVATSLSGGVIKFEGGHTTAARWPENLNYRFVYSGKPASTKELVMRFNEWRNSALTRRRNDALSALINASGTLANGGINLDNLAGYIQALRALDDAAKIGIYSTEHQDIATAAERHRLLYKPCGAGGGDLGVAVSDSSSDLDGFARAVGTNYAVIDLEISAHGLYTG